MTAEQMREEAAKVADDLERRLRASAAKEQAAYDSAWIGATRNRMAAMWLNEAANGLAAVARVIRSLPTGDSHGDHRPTA